MEDSIDAQLFNVPVDRRSNWGGGTSKKTANGLYKEYSAWAKKNGQDVLPFKDWVNWAKHKGYIYSADATSTRPTSSVPFTVPKIVVGPVSSSGPKPSTNPIPPTQQPIAPPQQTKTSGPVSSGGSGGGGEEEKKSSDAPIAPSPLKINKWTKGIAWTIVILAGIGFVMAFTGEKQQSTTT